jgi:SAM-dependent methyltransferase/1-acyl-sn-glycerol-3-phosphate acyltransferase
MRLARDEFARRKALIDVESLAPQFVPRLKAEDAIQLEGSEHLKDRGPLLLAPTHCAAPFIVGSGCNVNEDAFIAGAMFRRIANRPLWMFADLSWYDKEMMRYCDGVYEKMGFFPGTLENAVTLLRMGEAVGIWPEGRASLPGYQLRPYFWGFAKVALQTGHPVVPLIVLGAHEAHLRLERAGRSIVLNPERPCKAHYRVIALPPWSPGSFATDESDSAGLSRFCEEMRQAVQARIDKELPHRPLMRLARSLHEAYSESLPPRRGTLIPPERFLATEVDRLPPGTGVDREQLRTELRKAYFARLVDVARAGFRGESRFETYGLWDKGARNIEDAGRQLLDRLLERVPDRSGKLLEIQCSAGGNTRVLAEYFSPDRLVGIDRNGDHKRNWRELGGCATFLLMDPMNLTFEPESFDYVMCVERAHLLKTRERLLGQAFRALKPGGLLLMSDMLYHAGVRAQLRERLQEVFDTNALEGPRQYGELLARLGFVDITIEDALSRTVQPHVEHFARFITRARLAGRLDEASERALIDRELAMTRPISHYLLITARKPAGTGATPSQPEAENHGSRTT